MLQPSNARTGAQILVDALRVHGAEFAFCVAGESYLDVLDAFVDVPSVRVITCRHESGAGFMAEAYGKLTGRPGICFVTRGPGACNGSIAVHTAFQDSTPMIMFVGQIAREMTEREAFQEIDYRRMFSPLAKWAAQIDDAARIPEFLARAFHVATSGRPGPVVLALPEDMLADRAAVPDTAPYVPVRAHPGQADLERMREMLARAQRPMMLVGGSGWTDEACADIRRFAEANNLPVCCSFRRQDILDNTSPSFVGDMGTAAPPKLVARIKQADLLLVAGARLGEITTQGYELLTPPELRQTLVHVHVSSEELGRVFRPDLAIQSGMPEFASAVARLSPEGPPCWADWAKAAREEFVQHQQPDDLPGGLDLGQAFLWLRDRLPPDAIVTSDAGNFSGWANRFLCYRRPGRQLGPTNGAMGYGVPAAVAASIANPDRIVVAMVGDGGFLMTGQEIATAMQAAARPIIMLFNNGMYGTIRMHQERRFPGRISGTDLMNPDFAALARTYGAVGIAIERTEDFGAAFDEAVDSGKPAVLELRMNPEHLTTRRTLTQIREAALAAR
jgi:acetolactate synthase-1/2/3 large subunit